MPSRQGALPSPAEIDAAMPFGQAAYLDAFTAFTQLAVDRFDPSGRRATLVTVAKEAIANAAEQHRHGEFIPPLPDELAEQLIVADSVVGGNGMESIGTAGGKKIGGPEDIQAAARLMGAIAYSGLRPKEFQPLGTM